MSVFRIFSIIFVLTLFLFPIPETFAHGGGHESSDIKGEEPVDSMYSVKEADSTSDSDEGGMETMFSPSDLFTQEELVSPDPMGDMKAEGSHSEHADGPKVELAHHTQVSSSSKGFGVAVGITLFAGIVFAGLTFKQQRE